MLYFKGPNCKSVRTQVDRDCVYGILFCYEKVILKKKYLEKNKKEFETQKVEERLVMRWIGFKDLRY